MRHSNQFPLTAPWISLDHAAGLTTISTLLDAERRIAGVVEQDTRSSPVLRCESLRSSSDFAQVRGSRAQRERLTSASRFKASTVPVVSGITARVR
jgi:hypothetical protein